MLALAGYQNRDKITEMLTGAGTRVPTPGPAIRLGRDTRKSRRVAGGAGSTGGGTGGAGNLLNNGLNELSIASSKMDRPTRLNLGSSRVPIRRYRLLN